YRLPFLRHSDMTILYYTLRPYAIGVGGMGLRFNFDPEKGVHIVVRGKARSREARPVDNTADELVGLVSHDDDDAQDGINEPNTNETGEATDGNTNASNGSNTTGEGTEMEQDPENPVVQEQDPETQGEQEQP